MKRHGELYFRGLVVLISIKCDATCKNSCTDTSIHTNIKVVKLGLVEVTSSTNVSLVQVPLLSLPRLLPPRLQTSAELGHLRAVVRLFSLMV